MALEPACYICSEKLGACPEKYWSIHATEYERICYLTYHDISHINMYICNDCMNKLKKEIEK